MFEIPNLRVFSIECLHECVKHFPAIDDVILDEMAARLMKSFIHGPIHRHKMTESEMRQRCQQLIESLKELERD